MDANVCRVCMITSEVFYYCSLLTQKIFKNIRLGEAFELITGLKISDNDGFPTVICFRCEKQLRNAYHFRQLAESSAKHFALIRQTNSSNQSPPRILNVERKRRSDGNNFTNYDNELSEEGITEVPRNQITDNDGFMKTECVIDEESSHCDSPVVYVVDVTGSDGDVEIKRQNRSRKSPSITSKVSSHRTATSTAVRLKTNPKCKKTNYSERTTDGSRSNDDSDAISFLLQNKHLKNDDNNKDDSYQRRKYGCTVCDKKFVGKSNLVDHLRYHANIRNFKCDYCDKTFVQSGSLKSHMRTHTAERPYICSYCSKSFAQKSALTVHIRTHTQERKYVCNTCSKAFMTTGDLIKHKLIHDSIKKFSCDVCGMRSAQKVNIKKHRLKVHGLSEAAS